MTSEMSVPLSHAGQVQPGEEVDVAVEMVAPADLGRYLGYWRLTGPHGRRKFGQRVWCHVQVVDPAVPASMPSTDDELKRALAEIEQKKSDLAATDPDGQEDDKEDEEAEAAPMATEPAPLTTAVLAGEPVGGAAAGGGAAADVADRSDDGMVLVTEGMCLEPEPAKADGTGDAALDKTTPEGVKAALGAMGFVDASMVEVVLAKHGADLDACARDLAAATEWDSLLDDLAEMGFEQRELNRTLLLKHDGNVKRTVKALVEDA